MSIKNLTNGATDGVVKIGDTIRKPRGPWASAVEALLRHLEKIQFPYAPRLLGIDEHNRQILSYIAGTAGHYPAPPFVWSDATLVKEAQMLRLFHDSTASFDWNTYPIWQGSAVSVFAPEVICHNDFATYNLIYEKDNPIAIIDFDTCSPGTRAWDIAYAAIRCLPLGTPEQQKNWGVQKPENFARRLDLFLETYGIDDLSNIIHLMQERLTLIKSNTEKLALGSGRNANRIRNEKHIESYQVTIAYFEQQLRQQKY